MRHGAGGTHTPNSHRARERKAKRRQAHAEGRRKSSPPKLSPLLVHGRMYAHYDYVKDDVVAKPPKRKRTR